MLSKKLIFFFFLLITNSLCGQSFADNYFYYKPDSAIANNKWIILLPGSDGLSIFNDKTFYNRQADTLRNLGFTVLLIDYKNFYKESNEKAKPSKSTGEKIAWVVKKVISIAQEREQINNKQKGHLIGWSLGGEGVFSLVKDSSFTKSNKIVSAALYYPSNQTHSQITSMIPLLVLVGQNDNLVNPNQLIEKIDNSSTTRLIIYENAYHGFDVESLTTEKKLKFPPVIGKKYIFKYNAEAAVQATKEVEIFLNREADN